MKLLASLVAAASADYACCPYDEFGVVFAGCPLSEKTPWAIDPSNSNAADPHGVEHHMCKAWEVKNLIFLFHDVILMIQNPIRKADIELTSETLLSLTLSGLDIAQAVGRDS